MSDLPSDREARSPLLRRTTVGCLLLLVALPGFCVWGSGEPARRHARARAQVRAGMSLREVLAVGDAEGMTRVHLEPRGFEADADAALRHRVVRHRDGWVWHEPFPHEPGGGDLDEVARVFEREVATVTTASWSLLMHWPSPGWDVQGPDLVLPLVRSEDAVRVGAPGP